MRRIACGVLQSAGLLISVALADIILCVFFLIFSERKIQYHEIIIKRFYLCKYVLGLGVVSYEITLTPR